MPFMPVWKGGNMKDVELRIAIIEEAVQRGRTGEAFCLAKSLHQARNQHSDSKSLDGQGEEPAAFRMGSRLAAAL